VPFLIFEGESRLSPRDACETLRASVGRFRWFALPKTPFAGKVSESGFSIMRVVSGRDSFNPMLYGRFIPTASGTRVRVILTLHPLVWLFILVWMGVAGRPIYNDVIRHGQPVTIGEIGFALFPLLMAVPFFFLGAAASKKLLRRTLHLDEPSDTGG